MVIITSKAWRQNICARQTMSGCRKIQTSSGEDRAYPLTPTFALLLQGQRNNETRTAFAWKFYCYLTAVQVYNFFADIQS